MASSATLLTGEMTFPPNSLSLVVALDKAPEAALLTALPMMLYQKYRRHWWMLLVLFAAFVFSEYEIANGSSNPFLYFRF